MERHLLLKTTNDFIGKMLYCFKQITSNANLTVCLINVKTKVVLAFNFISEQNDHLHGWACPFKV